MIRTFCTHRIRHLVELTQLWSFRPLATERAKEQLTVAVPSCWENYPGFGLYRGKAAYETSFAGKGNVIIVCKGVSHTATVFVDGQEIMKHYNAYTAFSGIYRASDVSKHTLRIEVSNEFTEESALHIPNDYMSYGGIIRPVIIEEIPDVFIEWVHATPQYNNGLWQLEMETKLTNIGDKAYTASLCHTLDSQSKQSDNMMIPPNTSVIAKSLHTYEDVTQYDIENPVLYELETMLYLNGESDPVDDLIERVGFRTVQVKGKEILLNGRAIRIKGFCRHEDHPQFGCALPFQAIAYDINIIKDLGANAIRTSHYPNDELFLDLCDEKGILVWEENHARGLNEQHMKNPNFKKQCNDCIQEMIRDHYNHPSIMIWGILNECASETEYGKECYAEQFNLIKELDVSRPTSFASCKFFNDLSLGLPDIVSYNIYPEWYHDTPVDKTLNDIFDWVQDSTEGSGKPFLIAEIGAGAIYGNRNPYHAKWSEERQSEILSHQLQTVLEKKECVGLFIWQYCDIRISEEWFANRPRTMNNKGIVDEYRRPKLSYNTVKSIFTAYSNYRNN